MATTTTNFGWDIPQSTDLVKDGATAIAALGQDIDTALIDLKGGTTGQVLSKASGTDLDFSWVAGSASGPAFAAYRATSQSFTPSVWTKVQFNAEDFDTDSTYDSVTNYRFTPNKAGYYQVNHALFVSSNSNDGFIAIYKNGAEYKRLTQAMATNGMQSGTILMYFNGTTDYVEFYGNGGGGSPSFLCSTVISGASAVWIRS